MPDEITLESLLEKLDKIEKSLSMISTFISDVTEGHQQETENTEASPFFNPDTGLYDIRYYRKQQAEKEKDD
jgi:hypothetical protein